MKTLRDKTKKQSRHDSLFCEHLDAMVWYMEGAGHTFDEAHGILSASDLTMAAAVWARTFRFLHWPWPLTHAASTGDIQAFHVHCMLINHFNHTCHPHT